MYKLLILLVLCNIAFAKESKTDKHFEIVAKNLHSKNNIIYASGNVVIFSNSHYITADKAIYDSKKKLLNLDGNVFIMNNNQIELISKKAKIDLDIENGILSPFLMYYTTNGMWINSSEGNKKAKYIELKDSILSSCNCEDPDWSFRFTSGTYNTKSKWINTFNTRMYFKSIPILYTPYFGFPTNTQRRTGILAPSFGLSQAEGFIYTQPIFIAPSKNYDFEFIPQIRTNRGNGIYAYYRYADSAYSTLKFKTGYFEEKGSYYKNYDLKNEEHYGADLVYDRSNLFSNNTSHQDAAFVSLHWLNDIDYKNLQDDNYSYVNSSSNINGDEDYGKKIESKINYFFNTPTFYIGTYAKYYEDLSQTTNTNTMQELPSLQFHSFKKSFLDNFLSLSVDTSATNYQRQEGVSAYRYDGNIPLTYSTSLFNNYLNFNFSEIIDASYIDYYNMDTKDKYKNALLVQNEHQISLSTDLIKPYSSFVHSLRISAKYNMPNTIKMQGDIYKLSNDDSNLDYFPTNEMKKNVSFEMQQSFYSKSSLQEILRDTLDQELDYDENNKLRLNNVENELELNYSPFGLSNQIIYNQIDEKQVLSSTNIDFTYDNVYLKSTYYLSKKTKHSDYDDAKSYTFDIGYTFDKNYSLSYYRNYNLLENIKSQEALSVGINNKCWNLNFKIERGLSTSSNVDNKALTQNILYFTLELKPFVTLKQEYSLKNTELN